MPAPYINWLASYPKSGNTWVRAFLEHYEKGAIDINNMDVVMGDERIYYYQAVTAQAYETLNLYEWAMIRPAALNMYLDMNQRRDRIIVKTHNAHATVGEIPLFPPLIFGPSVYLVRDVIDVIPSFARHTGRSIDEMITRILNNRHAFEAKHEKRSMIGFLSSWANHVQAWAATPDTIVIRYEDLRDNPEYWFGKILKQFGYEINKSKVLAAIEATTLDKLQEQESAAGFKEVGKGGTFFGGTKTKLTDEQISRIIDGCETAMRKFGYLDEELNYGCNH